MPKKTCITITEMTPVKNYFYGLNSDQVALILLLIGLAIILFLAIREYRRRRF